MNKSLKPGFWDYFLVTVQFILLAAYLFLPELYGQYLSEALRYIGVAVMLFGAVIMIWALLQLRENLRVFPTPIEGGHLVDKGVFHYIRHPIYSGIIFMALGYAIYNSSFNHLVMALIIFLFFYIKARYEEQRLAQVYPEYEAYKMRTGMFLPGYVKEEQEEEDEKQNEESS